MSLIFFPHTKWLGPSFEQYEGKIQRKIFNSDFRSFVESQVVMFVMSVFDGNYLLTFGYFGFVNYLHFHLKFFTLTNLATYPLFYRIILEWLSSTSGLFDFRSSSDFVCCVLCCAVEMTASTVEMLADLN